MGARVRSTCSWICQRRKVGDVLAFGPPRSSQSFSLSRTQSSQQHRHRPSIQVAPRCCKSDAAHPARLPETQHQLHHMASHLAWYRQTWIHWMNHQRHRKALLSLQANSYGSATQSFRTLGQRQGRAFIAKGPGRPQGCATWEVDFEIKQKNQLLIPSVYSKNGEKTNQMTL